jgi:uridine phosphorylase
MVMKILKRIPPSELILHPDGSIYHLNIRPENLAQTVILVGDPQRVDLITGYFGKIEFKAENREIRTQTGYFGKKRITVMSTGMGTDNIDIVINELDALVNIDLETRTEKEQHSKLNIFRIGTSGALQPDIPLNSMVLSEYGLGLDGVMRFYKDFEKVEEKELGDAFVSHANWLPSLPKPYAASASEKLRMIFGNHLMSGITATAPGFYAPQGRQLRLSLAFPNLTDILESFEFKGKKILNFEMETSALYGLSKLLGHHALTLCIAIANRNKHDFNQDYKRAMKELIEILLNTIDQRLPD